MDDDDERTDAPAIPARFLASMDVSYDQWVIDIGPRFGTIVNLPSYA
jgi:hypothetical protein